MEGGGEPATTSSWKRWAVIGGIVVLIIAGAAGGVAGWKVSSDKNTSKSSTSKALGTVSNSNDPSDFTKDERLHQSFYGIAYTVLAVHCITLTI